LKGHENDITAIAITKATFKNENYFLLASASRDSYIRLWKVADFANFKEDENDMTFQSKNNHKLEINENKTLTITLESVLNGHTDHISAIKWGLIDGSEKNKDNFDESNLCLLSSSFDFSCYMWINNKKEDLWVNRLRFGQIGGNKNAFFGITFNGDYSKILAYTFSGAFYIWNLIGQDQHKLTPTVSGHFSYVTDIDWNSTGDYLVSCS